MPRHNQTGLTMKEEMFARAIVAGVGPLSAYRRAYATSRANARAAKVEASRIKTRPHVAARITELNAKVIESVVREVAIDKASILQTLVQIVERGMADGNLSAAIRALELLGKDQGMFVDRRMNVPADPLDGLTTVELRQLLGALDGEGRKQCLTTEN